MSKLAFVRCLLCSLSVVVSAAAQDAVVQQKVIVCTPGENCASRYVLGRRTLTIEGQEITVSADLVAQKRFTRARVTVSNRSPEAVDVLPANFQLLAPQNGKALTALVLPAVLKTERHRDATWGNFFDMGPSATKRETVITAKSKDRTTDASADSDNQQKEIKVTEITVPDEDARAAARARIQERKDQLSADCLKIEASYLRASTVDAGDSIAGMVYFPPTRPGDLFTLSVVIGAYRYDFPLAADAEN